MSNPKKQDRMVIESAKVPRSPKKSMQIPAKDLTFVEEFQRRINPAWVKKLAKIFDLDAIGTVTISDRGNGKLVIVDGQHRITVLLSHDLGDWKVDCKVYRGLSQAQEAVLYVRLNYTKPIAIYDKFKAGLIANDSDCLGVQKVVRSAGLEIGSTNGDGRVACIAAILEIYRSDDGAQTLADCLRTVISAWGKIASAVENNIVRGFAIVLGTYGDQIDNGAFVKKLSKMNGGPSALVGRARAMKDIRSAPLKRLVASIIVATYNRGRRAGKLDEL